MRYVLAIGIETEIFKKPVLEVFLNDRFLGMSDLEESIPAQLQKHKKGDLLDAWDRGNSTKHPERIYDIMVPKKWIIYELDDSTFKKENTLEIVPRNLQTNNMNGFITKMDKCRIHNVILLPKDWFSTNGVQKIFDHCEGKNIVIDFDEWGWPMAPTLWSERDPVQLSVPVSVYNKDITYKIIFDEILQIYVLGREQRIHEGKDTSVHVNLKEYMEAARNNTEKLVPVDTRKIYACYPQKPFENNDATTMLMIGYDTKVQLVQITTKYHCNED